MLMLTLYLIRWRCNPFLEQLTWFTNKYKQFISDHKRSCGKVMFLLMFVCAHGVYPSIHMGRGVCVCVDRGMDRGGADMGIVGRHPPPPPYIFAEVSKVFDYWLLNLKSQIFDKK